jgi:hypothetical protein
MTVEQTKALQPKLSDVERLVLFHNSKNEYFYFHDAWVQCYKKMLYPLVGWGSDIEELKNCEVWDAWVSHIQKLSKLS